MEKTMLTLAVLAGGKSKRMGSNKALLTYENTNFLQHLLVQFQELGTVLISASKALAPLYESCGVPVVIDTVADAGPLGGIASVLEQSQSEWTFICAVDMPFISRAVVQYLYEFCASDYDCVCFTVHGHNEPLCAWYRKTALPVVLEQLVQKDFKLQHLLDCLRTKKVAIEWSCFGAQTLANINCPTDYENLLKLNFEHDNNLLKQSYDGLKLFCVCGAKNTGKTTLICKLLKLFAADGYKVSVIKHDGHDFIIDYPATDTARFTEAGAVQSLIYNDRHYALMGNSNLQLDQLLKFCSHSDYVIVEGMKNSFLPKIEIVRRAVACTSIAAPQNLLALVTDVEFADALPQFKLEETEKLYKFLLAEL